MPPPFEPIMVLRDAARLAEGEGLRFTLSLEGLPRGMLEALLEPGVALERREPGPARDREAEPGEGRPAKDDGDG